MPDTATYLAFGTYQFPSCFKPISHTWERDIAEQERLRIAGSVTQTGRPRSRSLQISGNIMGDTAADIQAIEDEVRAGLESNSGIQPLYFGRSDRYINAQVTSAAEVYASGSSDGTEASWYGAAHGLVIGFVAGWPYFLAASGATTVTLEAAGGTITPKGNADQVYAFWTLPITTGGTGTIKLSNAANGQFGVLSGTFNAGDTITLQRGVGVYQVLYNGTSIATLLSGMIPMLTAGANVISIATTGGLALGAPSCVYTESWNS